MFLRQSTSQVVRFGPFVDSTDGVTAETGLTIAQADMQLSKDGGAFAQKNTTGNATHDADGWYSTTLDTTDTATVGELYMQVNVSGAIPVWVRWYVVEEAIYDAFYAGSATGLLPANVTQISGDSTAADNLELQYDGTGLTGGTFPATQDQAALISSTASSLVSTAADDNANGTDPLNGVTFVGVITGTNANLSVADGTYFTLDDTGNAFDLVIQHTINVNAIPLSVEIEGYLSGSNDAANIQVYDHDGTSWVTVATWAGKSDTTNDAFSIPLGEARFIGSSGEVYVRHVCTGQSNPTLNIDRQVVTYLNQSVGYAEGAVWLDTNASNTNTVSFVDGVADNPVSTIAAALTIASAVGLNRIQVATGSSVTLAASLANYSMYGNSYTLALGGQSIDGAFIEGATVSGTFTSTTGVLSQCIINAITGPGLTMRNCYFNDVSITANGAGTWYLNDCRSRVAGFGNEPTFDFGALVGNTDLNVRAYSGGLELQNMGDTGTDQASVEGIGNLTLNANCDGGELVLRGPIGLTDNSGNVSIQFVSPFADVLHKGLAQGGSANTITLESTASATDDTYDPGEIIVIGGTGLGQARSIIEYNGTTKVATVDRDWRVNPDSTSSYVIKAIPGNIHVNEGAAQGGASTTITLNSNASATDDIYIGQTVFVTAGTGADQARVITDYNGTTKVATVHRAWDTNPASGSSYIVLPLPTVGDAIVDMLGSGFDSSTDSLEAIRDRGDAAWTTGAGGSPPDLLQSTTIATLASQTSFTLTAGSADDDAYNGAIAVVTDQSTATQKCVGQVSDYTGSTKTVTLSADPGVFTMAVGDTIDIVAVPKQIDAILDDTSSAGVVLAGTPDVNVAQISGSSTAADLLELSTLTIVSGVATGTPTTTTMAASALSEDTDDHYIGRIIIWTSGALQNQATDITDYDGTTKTFTFTAVTEAASASDTFIIV